MRVLSIEDLDFLATGCAVLGSGGGGNPSNERLMARHAFEKYGAPSLVDVASLLPEDLILPLAVMGAPLVALEKLPSGREFEAVFESVKKRVGRAPTILMPAEIGGANGFAALSIAAKLNLPLLDADLMGRAFPQLQMTSCTVRNVPSSPAYLADSRGNTAVVEAGSAQMVENIARHITVSMGSSCGVGFALQSGSTAKQTVIPGSLSQAIELGKAIALAAKAGEDPVQAIVDHSQGICLGTGTITAIDQSIQKGFLEGSVTVVGQEGAFRLFYQNEYLLAEKEGVALACTPDILVLLERESGTPITAESLRYGLRVALIALPAPAIWQSEEGLKLVGPQCFGYDIEYQTVRRRP